MRTALTLLSILLCVTWVDLLKCYTCTNSQESSCNTETNCTNSDHVCQSVYTISSNKNVTVTKSCADKTCQNSTNYITTTACCSNNYCNGNRLKCYNKTMGKNETLTVCTTEQKYCKITRNITDNSILSIGCEIKCEKAGGIECCQEDFCRSDRDRPTLSVVLLLPAGVLLLALSMPAS